MTRSSFDRRTWLSLAGASFGAFLSTGAAGAAALQSRELRLSDREWRRRLGPERFHVLRKAGTEKPYSSPLNAEGRKGVFDCAGCRLPLFSSATKYDSRTGWPSFYRPLPNAVVTAPDTSLAMVRTEVMCRRCGGHLGHRFDDGPRPTGLRYCINGLALSFDPA